MTASPATVPDRAAVPSWDEVLAEVEADVERTEQLLRASGTAPGAISRGPLSPAELMLPGPAPALPDLAHMPPLPASLVRRLHGLHQRIESLSAQLAIALEELRVALVASAAREPGLGAARGLPSPHFVDRRL